MALSTADEKAKGRPVLPAASTFQQIKKEKTMGEPLCRSAMV